MLKSVDALCGKYGLQYTIYCGTLLGAVRHGGFIPWDDDVDLAMPLKDYRRFLHVAKELPDRFECCNYENKRVFPWPWTKVVALNTTHIEDGLGLLDAPWGLHIDVYPFIGAWPFPWGDKLQFILIKTARVLRSAELYHVKQDRELIKKCLYLIPSSVRSLLANMLLKLVMYDPEKAERIGTIDGAPFEGKFSAEDWKEMTHIRFEDAEFPAPVQYDRVLKIMYGNYIQLPPAEQRTGHGAEENTIIDPFRAYQEYRKDFMRDAGLH